MAAISFHRYFECHLPICSLTAIPKVHVMEFTVHSRAVKLNKHVMAPVLVGGLLKILDAKRLMSQFGAMESFFIKPH